jgi:hypothetical protein
MDCTKESLTGLSYRDGWLGVENGAAKSTLQD